MMYDVEESAELLETARVGAIVFSCTSGSFIKGAGHGKEIERLIEDSTGVTGIAASAAIIRALDSLDINSLSVATPYPDNIKNDILKEFLEDNGYDVLNIDNYNFEPIPHTYSATFPQRAYREAKDVNVPESDGLFISGTGYRTLEMINLLEIDLGKPVVTANQATLWNALDEIGVTYSDDDLGELLMN
jgi:maleate cis-trans isomerase